ncbi:MAG: hypothetical protein IJ275_06185, partial [Ruminococcus sp.]|nr:hypothetical protein [Ruminococcus sp.]
MKKYNAVFSLFLVIVIICISIAPTFALDNSYASNKLDEGLVAKLNEIDDNEKITVSIWFDDVDKELVKDKLYETYKGKKNADVYQKSEELLFGEVCEIPMNYTKDYLSYAKEYYKDITQEDFQYISERKREVYKDEYKKHNGNMINKVTDALDSTSIEKVYVSKYAPNVELELSKEEIFEVSELQNVDEIYFVNPYNELLLEESNICTIDNETQEYKPDDTFYSVTGLSTGRDVFGLTGLGLNVGVIEAESILTPERINCDDVVIIKQGTFETSSHGDLVCGLMVSNRNDFLGAIPEAGLRYTTVSKEGDIKGAVEDLLGYGVTAINCSFSYPYDGTINYNTYSDTAKWYDHVAVQHNVHLILTTSNAGSLGVVPSKTAYNAIAVGN